MPGLARRSFQLACGICARRKISATCSHSRYVLPQLFALFGQSCWELGLHDGRPPDEPGSLAAVRLTEFWRRMDEQFGSVYAQSVAKDYVLARLGGRTIMQALADGEDAKVIWRAVCAAFNVPERLR